MEVFTLAALAALVIKVTSAAKYLRAGQVKDFGTQVFVWLVGVGAAFLAVNSNAMASIDLNGVTLGSLDGGSTVLFGLGLSSLASFAKDTTKAIDGSDSAAEPSLF